MLKTESVLIIGAGLCGSLLALRLAQRGYHVTLAEKREDMRTVDLSAGRSINLALSNRGLKGIKRVGLEKKIEALCIPMLGRMLHDKEGHTQLSKYSGRDGEYINSISRSGLNKILLDELDTFKNVDLKFNHSCVHVDLKQAHANFKTPDSNSEYTIKADVIFGTDGAGSVVRQQMEKERGFLFSHSQNFLTHGYKELTFPPSAEGEYAAEKGALHIWPRGENMLIALPNQDKSFTVTLFLAYEGGMHNFNSLTTAESVEDYFKTDYPDALALMPNLGTEFFENPTAPLGTVRCNPWTYGKALLMGDASHAIVPFYGQGMNASFEDVVEFDDILQETNFDLKAAFKAFSDSRKPDADAIADLALDNFHEMKSHTAQDLFLEKRKLELALEKEFPKEYFSKYSLVTFNEEVSYKEAMDKGRAQDKAILGLLKHHKLNGNQSLRDQLTMIQKVSQQVLEGELLFEV
ncbi:FAD-dependent monooxygenase [Psychroflexus gondwanensis]|uniref:FAD-dependent oxidoreductase n=1 Tax=Psychroflexus gondwanensis TaxID=251 RepID=UPI0011BE82A4|nr:NAD(P)/FAD-dependent oxidoreductase [Psychroflexus gondwanensis]TXE20119.1 FAD-dependent monooxygenase [Psychroflexus gondwanensis]